jgi:hypothetical protein
LLDVFLTCDTEVWCRSWQTLDADFPECFQRYVHGRTNHGDFGLPFQTKLLREHGLEGVFFVEPLFTGRFGLGPLEEIVGIVREGGQEVQLHLHTEWADEAREPFLRHVREKRQHLRHFPLDEQETLIRAGAALIEAAGGGKPVAFRAGSFALNRDTLKALARCGILLDSSYNATMMGATSGIADAAPLQDITAIEGVVEFPVSVFKDGFGRLRHAQIGACSFEELRQALWAAVEAKRHAFVLVFHNFELMNSGKTEGDRVVLRRFERLSRFLSDHRSTFRTRGFRDVASTAAVAEGASAGIDLRVGAFATGWRYIEQAARRLAA